MDDKLNTLHQDMRRCTRCLNAGYDITPGAVFTGQASAEVMIIGQAPGVTEVEAGRPFNASSGRRLFQWLADAGWSEVDFRSGQYMTAVTKCFPGKSPSGRGDRVPSKQEQALCRPFLELEMRYVDPRLIIPVGGLAIKLFYPASATLRKVVGKALYLEPSTLRQLNDPFVIDEAEQHEATIPARPRDGRWLVPLPHPSGASAWPNQANNQKLIERATTLLGQIREQWQL